MKDYNIIKSIVDYQFKLHDAESIAWDLGYFEGYIELSNNPNYAKECRDYITSKVGKHWPKSVQDAYQRGLEQGWWES